MHQYYKEKIGAWGYICLIYIIMMSTWFKPLSSDDSRNLLLITSMYLSPVLLLIHTINYRVMKLDLKIYLLIALMFLCAYSHTESWRPTTFFYSCMFLFTFLLCYRIVNTGNIKIQTFLHINKLLIYAYAVFVLIQQACLIAGVEPINYTQSESVFEDTAFRINALSPEPSHIARFMLIFMVSYLSLRSIEMGRQYYFTKDYKSDILVWISYLWSMLTIGSATAILYVGMAMIPLISKKNIKYLVFIILAAIVMIMVLDTRSLDRAINIIPAALSLDIDTLFMIDASAAWRIAPLILFFRHLAPLSINFFIGNGIDYQRGLCERYLIGYNEAAPTGGYITMIMDYGFLSFLMLMIIIYGYCYHKSNRYMVLVFMLVVLPFIGINTQLFWCVLLFFMANRYYLNQKEKSVL